MRRIIGRSLDTFNAVAMIFFAAIAVFPCELCALPMQDRMGPCFDWVCGQYHHHIAGGNSRRTCAN